MNKHTIRSVYYIPIVQYLTYYVERFIKNVKHDTKEVNNTINSEI